MNTITLQEAQNGLAELIHGLSPGEVVTIIENDQPVACLTPVLVAGQRTPRPRPAAAGVPKAGRYKGRLVVPNDFKEPLEQWSRLMS